jgi:mono/diheme cytochrome c family protein
MFRLTLPRLRVALGGLALLGLAGFFLLTAPRAGSGVGLQGLTGDPAQGETVFRAAGCASCHAAPGAAGADMLVLAGGQAFPSDFGTFIAPNISPDPQAGIGGWTIETFAHAIQDGVSPDGAHYYPALPYAAYNKMMPQDVADLKAFMDGLPKSQTPSQPHQVGFPFNIRRTLGLWKLMFMRQGFVIQGDLTPEQTRGRYIAEALAHCGECHTPRNALGGLDASRWLGGAPDPSGKGSIPNITPGKLAWSEADIVEYLTSGFTPEFDSVGGHMAHVVENMSQLPNSDRQAIAAYLKIVPAVE